MKTRDEERAYDSPHDLVRRWWQPTQTTVGLLVIVIAFAVQFVSLHAQQAQLKALVAENLRTSVTAKHVADIAAIDAYHNCVVTRALEQWSKDLGHSMPDGDAVYQEHRAQIFNKLHNQLLVVDGEVCIKPANYEHVKVVPK